MCEQLFVFITDETSCSSLFFTIPKCNFLLTSISVHFSLSSTHSAGSSSGLCFSIHLGHPNLSDFIRCRNSVGNNNFLENGFENMWRGFIPSKLNWPSPSSSASLIILSICSSVCFGLKDLINAFQKIKGECLFTTFGVYLIMRKSSLGKLWNGLGSPGARQHLVTPNHP